MRKKNRTNIMFWMKDSQIEQKKETSHETCVCVVYVCAFEILLREQLMKLKWKHLSKQQTNEHSFQKRNCLQIRNFKAEKNNEEKRLSKTWTDIELF